MLGLAPSIPLKKGFCEEGFTFADDLLEANSKIKFVPDDA
jgi:hypothetical protein